MEATRMHQGFIGIMVKETDPTAIPFQTQPSWEGHLHTNTKSSPHPRFVHESAIQVSAGTICL